MSQSSNSTTNTNILSDKSVITADDKITSTGTERGQKRAAPSASEGSAKRSMTDYSSEKLAPNANLNSTNQLKFVSAAEIAANGRANVQMIPELSDEELLEMAIKFEKEHPQ